MLVLPWALGLALLVGEGRFAFEQVVLFGFWMVGYFAFFAATLWLKSRFKPGYLPALATYAGAAGVLGVALLLLSPGWWPWILVFAPICGFALWLAWRRRERGLASGVATIAAACLLPLVMAGPGPVPLAVGLVCFGYFFGTVLYVKTVIRERGKPGWVVVSVVWHVACAVAVAWAPPPLPAWWLVAFFAVVTLRALLVPVLGPMRGRRTDVKLVGIWEFVTSVALLAIVVPALLV